MPPGRNNSYLHYGKRPSEPPDGWLSEEASDRNPAYVFLSNALRKGVIDPYGDHHHIYSSNPNLYGIDPARFLRFFRKTVLNVLDIDLKAEKKSDAASTSAASFNPSTSSSTLLPSTVSSEASTHQAVPSKMDDDTNSSFQSFGGSQSHPSSRRWASIGTNADGFPNSATPMPMGSGPHQQLILEASLVQVDANFATVYIHDISPHALTSRLTHFFDPTRVTPSVVKEIVVF